MGIATSNYSSSNSLYLNPALIADNPQKITIDVAALQVGFDNNMATINTKQIYSAIRGDTGAPNINKLFTFNSSEQFSTVGPYAEMRLPGFVWKLREHNSIALTTRIRVFSELDHFNVDLLRTFLEDDFAKSGTGYNALLHQFNVTANVWSEIGLTYAGMLAQGDNYRINFGATVRYLNGIVFAGILGSDLNTNYNAETHQFIASGELKLASNMLNEQNRPDGNIGDLLLSGKRGSGASADIGFTYEYHVDEPESKMYKFKVSAAVTDLGYITYKNDNTILLKTNVAIDVTTLHNQGISNNIDSIKAYMLKHGLTLDSATGSDRVYLPRAIMAGIDYNIAEGFYTNVMFLINIADRHVFGNSYYNQVTVTPRYDKKHFTVSLPVSYNGLSKKIKLGMGIRVNHFFIGSDDMLVFFTNGQTGFNIYAGGSFEPPRIKMKWRMPKNRHHHRCNDCNTILNWGKY